MKLSSNQEILAENKALILYILDKINKPVSNDELFQIILSIDNMNYFYFQQFLLDLLENKYIINFTNDDGDAFYELTPEGKETLQLVKDIIPGFTKFKLDHKLEEDSGKNTLSITADFTPSSENEYSVTCKIMQNNKSLFEITTSGCTREQAKQITDNWKANATIIYPTLLEDLAKDYTKN